MNMIDEFLIGIPFNEITIKTTISPQAVMERIERGMQPFLINRQRGQFFTFEGSQKGVYFKIQGHLRNPDGSDAFPNKGHIRFAFLRLPIKMETSPVFYGRVSEDEENGSIITGHFGIPFPTFALLCAMALLLIGKVRQEWMDFSLGFSLFLIIWSLFSLIEFATERKGILDFLKGLFFDVLKTEQTG